jgi:hypothetical protein
MNIDEIIEKAKEITKLQEQIDQTSKMGVYRFKCFTDNTIRIERAESNGVDLVARIVPHGVMVDYMKVLERRLNKTLTETVADAVEKVATDMRIHKTILSNSVIPDTPIPFTVTVNPFDQQVRFECKYGVNTVDYEELDEWGSFEFADTDGVDHKCFDYHVHHDEEFTVSVYPVIKNPTNFATTVRYDNACDVTLNLTPKPL